MPHAGILSKRGQTEVTGRVKVAGSKITSQEDTPSVSVTT